MQNNVHLLVTRLSENKGVIIRFCQSAENKASPAERCKIAQERFHAK